MSTIRRRLGLAGSDAPRTLQLADDIREFPDRTTAAEQLKALSCRGVHSHWRYTGGVGHYYAYEHQFVDMFPELYGNQYISYSYHPDTDHVGYLCEHRQRLVSDVVYYAKSLARRMGPHLLSQPSQVDC